ncbi:MAG TPA: ABC transporter substrate-binding protein [Acidimicrobiia bacterium]|nr:ABC transporter substrate-binding protein [Acidimicrobiia bacterium]
MRFRKPSFTLFAALLALGVGAAFGAAPASGQTTTTSSGSKGNLVIGQILSETSASTPGQKSTDLADTLQAWAKSVNAKGGVNGYKVVVKSEDDGTDPAKASEAMKKLLSEGVVAIVGENATATESVWAPLATAAGVPIIGGGAYSTNWTANPLYFPVTTTAILDGLQAGVQNAADNGIKKIGATYDSAIPQAAAAAPLFENYAKKYGMTWTAGLGVDVTAADFTAQCVTLKQDGAQAIYIATGATELPRMARDCARQQYFPIYLSGDGGLAQDALIKNPNIKGQYAAIYSFPYLATNTPATKEFHAAMDKYAPKVLTGNTRQPATQIWTAAKAMEAAADKMTATNPTPQDVVNALYQFKDETLGGLAPQPITFTAGSASNPHISCYFTMQTKNHKISSPSGMKPVCVRQT